MKKILIVLLSAILLSGCDAVDKADAELASNDMFVILSQHSMVTNYFDFKVVYHKNTKVMYSVSRDGEVTVLVNADGTPMTYRGKKEP